MSRLSRWLAIVIGVLAVALPSVASAAPGPVTQTWDKAPMCFGDLSPDQSPLHVQVVCWKRWPASADQKGSPNSVNTVWLVINRASWALIIFLTIRVFFILIFSVKHHRRSKAFLRSRTSTEEPLVSIIVPCYNEEQTLGNCVRGLLGQTYRNCEILLVDDGSKDNTFALAQGFAETHTPVMAYHKQNGGKASALRYGIDRCNGPIVVCIDADSTFVPDTVEQLVKTFDDPNVHAVGGNVRVANRQGVLTACQALDYIIGLNSNGRAYSALGCMQVIPGAIGAFRRDAYYAVGGHSEDTLVEDMDLTVAFAYHGYRVIFNPHALAYTEAPVKMKDFINQRHRWTLGGMQVLGKYRKTFMLKRWHPMSVIGLPTHMVSPWINIAVSMLFMNSVAAAVLFGHPGGLVIFLGAMYLLQFSLLVYMLSIDGESKKFLFMTGIETIFYIHLLNFVTIRAGVNYMLGRKGTWQKIPRLGANQIHQIQNHREDTYAHPHVLTGDLEFESASS